MNRRPGGLSLTSRVIDKFSETPLSHPWLNPVWFNEILPRYRRIIFPYPAIAVLGYRLEHHPHNLIFSSDDQVLNDTLIDTSFASFLSSFDRYLCDVEILC